MLPQIWTFQQTSLFVVSALIPVIAAVGGHCLLFLGHMPQCAPAWLCHWSLHHLNHSHGESRGIFPLTCHCALHIPTRYTHVHHLPHAEHVESCQSDEMANCCPLPMPFIKWIGCWCTNHCYPVIFHPFVEQLTVFYIDISLDSFSSLPSSSILWVLHHDMAPWEGHTSKLCINPHISIVNSLRTDIQAQP